MPNVEQYLKPEVIQTVARLDLRAKFIVEGFLSGLHASPYHGFSVEFSEHRRYAQGDDPRDIDWQVYAKTDRYYIKKYQAETNLTGYLVLDLSESMAYTHRQQLSKFDYSICLAASLAYMMIHQQDPVGLITFGEQIKNYLPARSKRGQLGNILAMLANSQPTGMTEVSKNIQQIASMVKHRSLFMIFSDLLTDQKQVLDSLQRLRYAGHDVIVFHVLDEAEVYFPFQGMVDLKEPEEGESMIVDAEGMKADYLEALNELRETYTEKLQAMGVDYVRLDTSMPFDKALIEYLSQRKARF
ncbi:MAG: DUF58 domain-containing protein [Planctomycetes bacterium]|nr:DUF58 domain-containing protein [Planctomycetota bacterium]MCH9727883.1 DUF58 domain-containing protein [Planctomycetota bacterium]MCH9775449.1 DUF58 domain-containing protein [Planctomycetota bacterium]MCH9792736.1 DUF58 domain-containing protein [Planctomycetota bacterium]